MAPLWEYIRGSRVIIGFNELCSVDWQFDFKGLIPVGFCRSREELVMG